MTRWLIFPMAGLSERFTRAGFTVPKYMLQAHGRSLFRHAVEGFLGHFAGHAEGPEVDQHQVVVSAAADQTEAGVRQAAREPLRIRRDLPLIRGEPSARKLASSPRPVA